jgi:hypothetical protein
MYGQSAGLIFIKGISFKRITEKRKKTSKKSLERIKFIYNEEFDPGSG